MQQNESDNAPHSVGFWFRWEIHERKPNGQFAGVPKDSKDYNGALHCQDRKEALETIKSIIEHLTEDFKRCQQELQSSLQTNLNQPE